MTPRSIKFWVFFILKPLFPCSIFVFFLYAIGEFYGFLHWEWAQISEQNMSTSMTDWLTQMKGQTEGWKNGQKLHMYSDTMQMIYIPMYNCNLYFLTWMCKRSSQMFLRRSFEGTTSSRGIPNWDTACNNHKTFLKNNMVSYGFTQYKCTRMSRMFVHWFSINFKSGNYIVCTWFMYMKNKNTRK